MAADRRHALRSATRMLLAACVATCACTVDGEDGATSLGGTTVPATSATTATTTVGTATAMSTSATSSASDESDESDSDDSIDDTSPPTSDDTSPPDDTSGGGSGTDEQPADGVYSECETVVQCFGATACVTIMSDGYCSIACAIAGDCPPSPGGTAAAACVPANISGVDMTVCALDCSGGKTCPGGMECAALGASMVCV